MKRCRWQVIVLGSCPNRETFPHLVSSQCFAWSKVAVANRGIVLLQRLEDEANGQWFKDPWIVPYDCNQSHNDIAT